MFFSHPMTGPWLKVDGVHWRILSRVRGLALMIAIGLACASGWSASLVMEVEHADSVYPLTASVVNVRIRNAGEASVMLPRFPITRLLQVEMTDPAQEDEVVYRGPVKLTLENVETLVQPKELAPGATLGFQVVAGCRWEREAGQSINGPLFEKPGQYNLQFEYFLEFSEEPQLAGSALLKTEKSAIQIIDPQDLEAEAYEAILEVNHPEFLLDPGFAVSVTSAGTLSEVVEGFSKVLTDFPENPWKSFIRFGLASIHHNLAFRQRPPGTERLKLARGFLSGLAGLADFPFSPNALRMEVFIRALLGEEDSEVEGSVQEAVTGILNELATQLQSGNSSGVEGLLSSDFLFNGVLNRAQTIQSLVEEFAKAGANQVTITLTIQSISPEEGGMKAKTSLSVSTGNQNQTGNAEFFLVELDGVWKIAKWIWR